MTAISAEIELQADNGPDYIVAFIGANVARFPWTIELIDCGLSIGNIAYSYYKAHFKRVRPSFLCPGLAPPFGPPGHPSFPSGHSFLGHLMALLLLEIPGIWQRFGMFDVLTANRAHWLSRQEGRAVPDSSNFKWQSRSRHLEFTRIDRTWAECRRTGCLSDKRHAAESNRGGNDLLCSTDGVDTR